MKPLAIVAACASILGGPASAATVLATYSGTVHGGTDPADLFGGGSLAGDPYSVTFTIDDSLGQEKPCPYCTFFGGSYYGDQSPVLSAALTINGHSVHVADFAYKSTLSDVIAIRSGVLAWGESSVFGENAAGTTLFDFQEIGFAIQGATFSSGPGFFSSSNFSYGPRCCDSFQLPDGDSAFVVTTSFSVVGLTPSQVTVVPEPAIWALMIAGLGVVGGALRSRRLARLGPPLLGAGQ